MPTTDDISDAILGKYYRITGPVLGRYVFADEFEQLGTRTDAEELGRPVAIPAEAREILGF